MCKEVQSVDPGALGGQRRCRMLDIKDILKLEYSKFSVHPVKQNYHLKRKRKEHKCEIEHFREW